MTVNISTLTGQDLKDALRALARLRIEVFRDFPYLYDGTLDYETQYLERFAQAKDSILIAARDAALFVGCATGSALSSQHDEFAAPFLAQGHDIGRIFYCGESVLLPHYRGQGLGHAFFDGRESHAKMLGYAVCTFCAVIREDNHALRPVNYRTLHGFWKKRGYRPVEGLVAKFPWKDIDQPEETDHTMQFWMRGLT